MNPRHNPTLGLIPPLHPEISGTKEGGTRLIHRIDKSFVQLAPSAHPPTTVNIYTRPHRHTYQLTYHLTMERRTPFHLPSRSVPDRSSSRSPEKSDAFNVKRLRDLTNERDECNRDAKKRRKELKLKSSFDTRYWTARRDLADKERQATSLTRQISIASLKSVTEESTKAFLDSEEGRSLFLQEQSLELDIRLYQTQAEKMRSQEEKSSFCRAFMDLFTGAKTGLGIKNSRGQRDNSLQSNFVAELMTKLDSRHPDTGKDEVWCPATGRYWPKGCMTAGHIFPSKCGETTIETIFGRPEGGRSELFRAENGILWSTPAEERFEGGHFVIVPDIVDQPTQQDVNTWEASDPREYKIRVLNPGDVSMKRQIFGTDKLWADLDNERMKFKTNFRPRARYLYFAYCAAMLRRSFAGKNLETSKAELRKKFWGARGRYMRESMLLGFVEEMGHDYEDLLEGAIEEEDAVADITAIAAANTQIQETLKAEEDCDSESGSDDDDNGEEAKEC